MIINLLDENFLRETEEFTDHHLNKNNDLQKIINISSSAGKEAEFQELAFTAKYVKGLMRIINKAPGIPEVDSIDHVKKDISENLKKILEQLRGIVLCAEDKTINYFEVNYLSLNQECMLNLNLLLDDLDAVKKYLNYIKRI
jgi:hypothetical protein